MAAILDDETPLPAGWNTRMEKGLAVYRGAYRARLVEALRETYPRSARWVGDESFETAAAHHVIANPPTSWTLDLAGAGFAETLADLFMNDPDVAELAWLEWAMHLAYTGWDCVPLNATELAELTSGFGEGDWSAMQIVFVPTMQQREVGTDCPSLWQSLGRDELLITAPTLGRPAHCLVWREEFSPVFRLLPKLEGECITQMRCGASFGSICEKIADGLIDEDPAGFAGSMLARWLSWGLVAGISRNAESYSE